MQQQATTSNNQEQQATASNKQIHTRKNRYIYKYFHNSHKHRDTLLVGVETRTSAPVRVLRDEHDLESTNTEGLYPIGEGAGWAGL